ncbi:energy transducer TonB [Sphingomonas aurantiaca]|uniref:energy transducer TonB n=1 Tax=Sphingomonas aurantiaca TaxID=185949 RepID=UPI00335E74EC
MKRLNVICAGLLSVGVGSAALAAFSSPQPDGAVVQRALDAHDYRRAGIELNKLITERLPGSDKGGPDPVLDRLFAELISANGTPASATTLLLRLNAQPGLKNRGHYQLLLATAREESGQFTNAERLYQSVSADRQASAEDRTSSVIGYARLRMITSPDDAISALQSAQPLPAQAWEVDLQRARAEALAGRDDAAQAAMQRAWSEAPMAGAEQGAAARVASDMMVTAGRKGDRGRLIAMLAVDRLNRGTNTGQEVLGADVPICGSAGITPNDSVAVEFSRQAPPGRPRFSLVWASRAGIAAAFLDGVARNPGFQVQDGQATTVVLKCRLGPAADYQVRADLDDQILSWSTSRGAYPLLDTGDESDTPSLASLLAERERRYGSTSVMLLPVLVQILGPTVASGMDNQEARARAAALSHRIADIIAANGAPADMVLFSALSTTGLDVAAQSKSVTAAQAEFQSLLGQAARNSAVSLDNLFTVVSNATAYTQAPTALRVQLLEQTIAVLRAHVPATDPRLMALGLRLLSVRREQGDSAAVAALIEQFDFAPDLCNVAAPPVRFTSSNITADDYPPDLVQAMLQGRTMLEFSISATGTATAARVLVSDPPFAFDAVALAKSLTLTYEPAKTAGVPRSCRAQVQPIRWQLP